MTAPGRGPSADGVVRGARPAARHHRRADGDRHAGRARLPGRQHPRRLGLHGRRARRGAAAEQRARLADELRAGADPAVPADGRDLLPHGPGRAHVHRDRPVAGAPARPAELRDGARRHRVLDAVGLVDGIDRAARLPDGARDEPPRLQEPHEHRPDPRHRRARDHHPAVGAGGAAGDPCADRRRRAADRGRDAGAAARGVLRRDDRVADAARPGRGARLRRGAAVGARAAGHCCCARWCRWSASWWSSSC